MIRTNLILLSILIICALSVVTSQHKARKSFIDLQHEEEIAKQLDIEWGQLQLEQSTWAMPARIEKIATGHMHMQVPSSAQVKVITMRAASVEAK
jgi:cell division protein FtsL